MRWTAERASHWKEKNGDEVDGKTREKMKS